MPLTCIGGYCLKPLGTLAASAYECASGFRSNSGHCCTSSCPGECQSCSTGVCMRDGTLCPGGRTCSASGTVCLLNSGQPTNSSSNCYSGILSHSGHCCTTTCAHCNQCSTGVCLPTAPSFEALCPNVSCIGLTGGWDSNSTCTSCVSNGPGMCQAGVCANATLSCPYCTKSTTSRPRCQSASCQKECPAGLDAGMVISVHDICKYSGESCGAEICLAGGACGSGPISTPTTIVPSAPSGVPPISAPTRPGNVAPSANATAAETPVLSESFGTGSGIQTGAIVGIVLGILFAIGLLVAVVLVVGRRRRARSPERTASQPEEDHDVELQEPKPAAEAPKAALNIAGKDLKRIKSLGEGSFGVVYQGTYRGKPVAIKQLSGISSSAVGDFFREASLMLSIPAHKNVVQMIGMCQEQNSFSLVMELVDGGSLVTMLEKTLRTFSL